MNFNGSPWDYSRLVRTQPASFEQNLMRWCRKEATLAEAEAHTTQIILTSF